MGLRIKSLSISSYMPEDDKTEEQIGSLIEQLKDTTALMKKPPEVVFELKPENAENFVLAKAGELVQESLTLVKDLKQTTGAASDAEGIEALAKLVAATASALEALNKIVIQDKKSKTAKEVKKMEVEARRQVEDEKTVGDGQVVLKGTREEIFKQLLKEADILEIESTPVEQTETESSE